MKYDLDTIFNLLTKQAFADFYNEGGEFDAWIRGEEDAPSEAETKAKLEKMLNRECH